jgi:hypothetical protein
VRFNAGILLIVLCLGTAMAMAVSSHDDSAPSEIVDAAVKQNAHSNSNGVQAESGDTDINYNLAAINRTVPKKIQSGGLFQSKSWYTPPPPPPPVSNLPPPQPVAPSLSFKYIGRMIDGNDIVLCLVKNGQQYTARVNDILDDNYRVDKISDNQAVLTYLPMNVQQYLPFNSAMTTSSIASPPLVSALANTAQIPPENHLASDPEQQK